MAINIGTAGWSIPRAIAGEFPAEGSALERYAARFPVAEINSSFHRAHRLSTWQRWRDSVPDDFRFSVKLPKEITHQRRLIDCAGELDAFIEQIAELGDKLAILLVQLPPKLALEAGAAADFFRGLAPRTSANLVCEPRHISWFTAEANELLRELGVSRVAADPALCAAAAKPGGSPAVRYWRLHGSPAIYRSSYADRIASYAAELAGYAADGAELWCIFDNTASSAGAGDALALMTALS
jgi:uncharacterized protein YecE (DUF72 family)